MVNANKHRKTNKNPFVQFLRHIEQRNQYERLYYESKGSEGGNELEDSVIIFLDENRTVRVYEGIIKYTNKAYFSMGGITTTVKSLYSDNGTIDFLIRTRDLSVKYLALPYSTKEELYEIISDFDSSKNASEFKNKLINEIEIAGIPEEEMEGVCRVL